jgi:hypothetical protein
MASLAEGVARLLEKQVAARYVRETDDVRVSTKPPGTMLRKRARPTSPQPPPRVMEISALDNDRREAIDVLLRQETNRTAFRKMYTQRIDQFKTTLREMEPSVAAELGALRRPEVVVGVRGREGTQIIIRAQQDEPPSHGPVAAAGESTTAPAPATKGAMRDGLRWASAMALSDLGVNPEQPFSTGLAAQIVGHPQLRPLVLMHLPAGLSRAAEDERHARAGATEAPRTVRTLTRNSRPRKAPPLVRVTIKKPRAKTDDASTEQ